MTEVAVGLHRLGLTLEMSFPEWAFSAVQRLRKAVGLSTLIAAAIAIGFMRPTTWPRLWFTGGLAKMMEEQSGDFASLAFIQAGACILLALLTPRAKVAAEQFQGQEARRSIAIRACSRVQRNVVIVFFLWALYYVIRGLVRLSGPPSLIDRAFLITISSLTSLVLYWLYLELTELTVESVVGDPSLKGMVMDSLAPAGRDVTMHKLGAVGLLAIAVGVTWFGAAAKHMVVVDATDILIGCLSGVGLCLVVGRLGSKFLDPGPITLSLLYFYAVIQPGAAMVGNDELTSLAVTTLALPLKILFWLVCVWAFTTGVLGEYVYEIRLLIERGDERQSSVNREHA